MIRCLVQGSLRDVDPGADAPAARESVPTGLVDTEFRLDAALNFFGSILEADEVQEYLKISFTHATKELIFDELVIAKFWVQNRSRFSSLSRVAMRLFETPPSSAAIERDFNDLESIISPDRNGLSSENTENITFVW